jgi:hypothetical protein
MKHKIQKHSKIFLSSLLLSAATLSPANASVQELDPQKTHGRHSMRSEVKSRLSAEESIVPCSMVASLAYNKDGKGNIIQLLKEKDGFVEIKSSTKDALGFQAVAFLNAQKKAIIIGLRGTQVAEKTDVAFNNLIADLGISYYILQQENFHGLENQLVKNLANAYAAGNPSIYESNYWAFKNYFLNLLDNYLEGKTYSGQAAGVVLSYLTSRIMPPADQDKHNKEESKRLSETIAAKLGSKSADFVSLINDLKNSKYSALFTGALALTKSMKSQEYETYINPLMMIADMTGKSKDSPLARVEEMLMASMGFYDEVLAEVKAKHQIDKPTVAITGHSLGAYLTAALSDIKHPQIAVTFNAPGATKEMIAKVKADLKQKQGWGAWTLSWFVKDPLHGTNAERTINVLREHDVVGTMGTHLGEEIYLPDFNKTRSYNLGREINELRDLYNMAKIVKSGELSKVNQEFSTLSAQTENLLNLLKRLNVKLPPELLKVKVQMPEQISEAERQLLDRLKETQLQKIQEIPFDTASLTGYMLANHGIDYIMRDVLYHDKEHRLQIQKDQKDELHALQNSLGLFDYQAGKSGKKIANYQDQVRILKLIHKKVESVFSARQSAGQNLHMLTALLSKDKLEEINKQLATNLKTGQAKLASDREKSKSLSENLNSIVRNKEIIDSLVLQANTLINQYNPKVYYPSRYSLEVAGVSYDVLDKVKQPAAEVASPNLAQITDNLPQSLTQIAVLGSTIELVRNLETLESDTLKASKDLHVLKFEKEVLALKKATEDRLTSLDIRIKEVQGKLDQFSK